MPIDVGAMVEIGALQKEVEIWKSDSERLSDEVITVAQRNLILNITNTQLEAKVKRLENLIAISIPVLTHVSGNPNASRAQQMLAKEALDAMFEEQDEYITMIRGEPWPMGKPI